MSWNHRVITDGKHLWVGEVYYEDDEMTGFTGPESSVLCIDADFSVGDLAGDAKQALAAFDLPVLIVPECFRAAPGADWKAIHGFSG